MLDTQFRRRYAKESNNCTHQASACNSNSHTRLRGLKAHTTSGRSLFPSPCALGAEVVAAATAKHETQGAGGGCRRPLNIISGTEAISDWGWEIFVGSA
jgi:hypothetical protein